MLAAKSQSRWRPSLLRDCLVFFSCFARSFSGAKPQKQSPSRSKPQLLEASAEMKTAIGFLLAGVVGGIGSGLFGIGGGIVLVPIFGLLLGFDQHKSQGTSLVALIPPTGLLAVIEYAKS